MYQFRSGGNGEHGDGIECIECVNIDEIMGKTYNEIAKEHKFSSPKVIPLNLFCLLSGGWFSPELSIDSRWFLVL